MNITPEQIDEWTRHAPAAGPERDLLIAQRAINHSADASKMVPPTDVPAVKKSLTAASARRAAAWSRVMLLLMELMEQEAQQ